MMLGLLLAGCPAPAPAGVDAGDSGSGGGDTGMTTPDAGHDAPSPPDAGPPALCTGTGCALVGIELMSESSCVIRANGQVDCWGRGQSGELGDGATRHTDNCRLTAGESDTDCSRAAVTVSLPEPAASVFSRGNYQACAILATSHQAWCWGGQPFVIGASPVHNRYAPEHLRVDTVGVADGASAVGLAFRQVCWIGADTHVQCLGGGGSGVLGNGSFSDTTTPVTVLMPDGTTPLTGALEVATQGGHTCARTASHLYCWGNNHYGQLGAAPPHLTCIAAPTMYDCSNVAVEVTSVNAATITSIAPGDDFTCVLHNTGHVQCWGGGQSGGLGNGDIHATTAPVEPTGLTGVDELRASSNGGCALRHDGTVWCWGPANLGQIGDGSMVHSPTPCIDGNGAPYDCQLTPVRVMGLSGVAHIGVGDEHACALLTSGEVWCWGATLRYQVGDMMRAMPAFAPVRVTALGP